MIYQSALRQLRFNKIKIFSLVGPEDFLKRAFIDEVRRIYSGHEFLTDVEGLHSGFVQEKIICVKNPDNLKGVVRSLEEFEGVAIFNFPEGKNLKSEDITTLFIKSCVVECGRLKVYGDDYLIWIVSRIMDYGYTCQDGVEKELFLRIGPDMSALDNEIYKLCAVKESEEIMIDDVERYVPVKAVKSAFDILEHVLRRDVSQALACFKMFCLTNNNLLELVKFMAGYFEKIYKILFLKYKKVDSKEIASRVGVPVFYVRTKYLPWATSLGAPFITQKYDELCRLDVLMRVFKGNKNILIENFIMGCAR